MKKHMNLDSMLASASLEERFDDGDRNRIWDNASARRKEAGRAKLKWLIPAAAACTVLVSLCAVPQARAAMTGFFGKVFDVMDYLLMDESARPDNTAVAELVQSGITAEVKVVPGSSPECAWVNDLNMRIDEVLFDGQTISIRYTLYGKGLDGFDLSKPATDSYIVHYKSCDTSLSMTDGSSVSSGSLSSWSSSMSPVKSGNGEWMAVSQFGYSNMKLSGFVPVKFTVSLLNVTASHNDKDGFYVKDSPAGLVEAYFSFDSEPGNAGKSILKTSPEKHVLHGDVIATQWYCEKREIKFYAINRKTSVEGSTLEVVSASQSPVETRMILRFTPCQSLEEAHLTDDYYLSLINIELIAGGKIVGYVSSASSIGKLHDFELVAPFIPEDAECLTAHVTFNYNTVFDGQKLELGKPVSYKIDGEHTFQIAECEIDGGTFDIDLTK